MSLKFTSLVQRNLHRGIRTWYARLVDTDTGRVSYRSMGTSRKGEARDLALLKMSNGEFQTLDVEMTLRRALDLYVSHLRLKGVGEATIETYEGHYAYVSHLFGRPLASVTRSDMADAFTRLSRLAPATYNQARVHLRSAFRHFVEVLELIPKSPMAAVPPRRSPKREAGFWTMDEVAAIIRRAPDASSRLAWAFMAYQGLRVHEAVKARPGDVDAAAMTLHVVGKGGKSARLPLSPPMVRELDRCGWDWDFTGMTCDRERRRVAKAARLALGDKFDGDAHPHRFRHSFASNLIRAGVNVKAVQLLMRHASIQLTLGTYSHLLGSDLGAEISKLDFREAHDVR